MLFVHSPAIIFDSKNIGVVILALQAYSGIHIGIDNLNVLRGEAALLSHRVPRTPLPLVKDGDLLATTHSMC